jgi:hypothetical protein
VISLILALSLPSEILGTHSISLLAMAHKFIA